MSRILGIGIWIRRWYPITTARGVQEEQGRQNLYHRVNSWRNLSLELRKYKQHTEEVVEKFTTVLVGMKTVIDIGLKPRIDMAIV
jgi:hypothetical protein